MKAISAFAVYKPTTKPNAVTRSPINDRDVGAKRKSAMKKQLRQGLTNEVRRKAKDKRRGMNTKAKRERNLKQQKAINDLAMEACSEMSEGCADVQVEEESGAEERQQTLVADTNRQVMEMRRKAVGGAWQVKEAEKNITRSLSSLLGSLDLVQNSRQRAEQLFQWLINPFPSKQFFRKQWEKHPTLLQRHKPDYYQGLFSTTEFDRILREEVVHFGVNLDVTSYRDDVRETHNPPGRALPSVVWDFYQNGCSLRLLNPQSFSLAIWKVLSILQEKFGSMAGANVYLTPPGTQGFAPHYDDIEAFVLQLEGKKHWRVYNPRCEEETLPRFSSPNYSSADVGAPILDVVLEAGDLIYFPRGFVHQAACLPDVHSLHLTLSTFQRNCFGDLLEKIMPAALQAAIEEDVAFREGLPLDYLDYMGVQNSETEDPRRVSFLQKVDKLIRKVADYAPVDAAVDQKAKDLIHDCLPPVYSAEEKACSVHGAPVRCVDGKIHDLLINVDGNTQIRLLRAGVCRLCSEEGKVNLYYTVENSRTYHKEEPKCIEIDDYNVEALEHLIHSYPKFVTVDSLPCPAIEEKCNLTMDLFEKGLLTFKEPLKSA